MPSGRHEGAGADARWPGTHRHPRRAYTRQPADDRGSGQEHPRDGRHVELATGDEVPDPARHDREWFVFVAIPHVLLPPELHDWALEPRVGLPPGHPWRAEIPDS